MRTLSFLRILTGLCLLLCFAAAVSGAEQQSINLSLGEAVQTALLKNLGLRLSKENVVSAEGTAQAAEGTFDYQLAGEIGAGGKSETPISEFVGADENSALWNAGGTRRRRAVPDLRCLPAAVHRLRPGHRLHAATVD